jgi:adenylate kinase
VNLLVLGPPGAGKGTQSKRIAQEYGIAHLSTGEMFRDAIAARSELGLRVEPILAAGEFVPDELTVGLIRERLIEPEGEPGFVLDGFPRNDAQVEALDEMLREIGRELDAILFFDLTDVVARDRMLGRAGEEHRVDDTPEVIDRRLRDYHAKTAPIVERYRTTGKLVPLHAERDTDEVWLEIQEALDHVRSREVSATGSGT